MEDKIFESFKEVYEAKTLSPANTKIYNYNKDSIKSLKKWSYKIKDIKIDFKDMQYFYKYEFNEFLEGNTRYLNDVTTFTVNNENTAEISIYIDDSGKPYFSGLYFKININKVDFNKTIGSNDDKILGFIDLLNYLFSKYENEIYNSIKTELNIEKIYVIDAGLISPATGKTGHGWSIYDSPNTNIAISDGGIALWGATNNMKVGDTIKLIDDQKHFDIGTITIKYIIKSTYDEFVKMSHNTGANIPVKAYAKQPGTFQYRLYSIK